MFRFIKKLILMFLNWIKGFFQKTEIKEVNDNKKVLKEDIKKEQVNIDTTIFNDNKGRNDQIDIISNELEDFISNILCLTEEEKSIKYEEIKNKIDILKYYEDKEHKNKHENKKILNSINKVEERLETIRVENDIKPINQYKKEEEKKEKNNLEQYKNYVNNSNKLLKEAKEELKGLTAEVGLNITNSKLERNKIKIDGIKEKIQFIKNNYYDFKNSDYIYVIESDFNLNEIDEFNIIESEEEIDLYLTKCNLLLSVIEEKKNKKEEETILKSDNIEEPLEVKEERKTEKRNPLLNDIEEASNLIKKDIDKQKDVVNKINIKIDSLPIYEQKSKKIGFLDNFITNTFKIGFSLFPLKIFKNKMLGTLLSGFILNNNIRSMRKILNPSLRCEYIEFNRRLKNQIDIINGYDTICNDSLYQISCLKEEFERIYGYEIEDVEVKKVYSKIKTLEFQINEQRERLFKTKNKLKNKVKVKKLERYK